MKVRRKGNRMTIEASGGEKMALLIADYPVTLFGGDSYATGAVHVSYPLSDILQVGNRCRLGVYYQYGLCGHRFLCHLTHKNRCSKLGV